MREQQTVAAVIQVAFVERGLVQGPQVRRGIVPLFRISRKMFFKRRAQRLQQIRNRPMFAVAKREVQGEFFILAPG